MTVNFYYNFPVAEIFSDKCKFLLNAVCVLSRLYYTMNRCECISVHWMILLLKMKVES
jgi:hypothetical protein